MTTYIWKFTHKTTLITIVRKLSRVFFIKYFSFLQWWFIIQRRLKISYTISKVQHFAIIFPRICIRSIEVDPAALCSDYITNRNRQYIWRPSHVHDSATTSSRHPRRQGERVFAHSLSLSLPKCDSYGEIVQRWMIAGVRSIAIIGALPGGP